jgi:hypothetical protein
VSWKPAVTPKTVTVTVLNGSGAAGVAGRLSSQLSAWGYRTHDGGNAPSFTTATTQVYYRAQAANAAHDLAHIIGKASILAMPPSVAKHSSSQIVIVTGRSLPARLAANPPRRNTGVKLPQTITRTSTYRAAFAPAHKRLGFPVMYPTVSQATSTLCPWVAHPLGYGQASCQGSPSTPVRIYRIPAAGGSGPNSMYADYYDTATNGYWGIEETRFATAPILATPNARRHLDGRNYLFFFNGSHIQTIAFIQNGVAYWVENTLLDDLTNQEMIAIARSLRPT